MWLINYSKVLFFVLIFSHTLWSSDLSGMLAALHGKTPLEVLTVARVYGTTAGDDFTEDVLPDDVCSIILEILRFVFGNKPFETVKVLLDQKRIRLQELQQQRLMFVDSEIIKISQNPLLLTQSPYRVKKENIDIVEMRDIDQGLVKEQHSKSWGFLSFYKWLLTNWTN
jgi:hypothetical protein